MIEAEYELLHTPTVLSNFIHSVKQQLSNGRTTALSTLMLSQELVRREAAAGQSGRGVVKIGFGQGAEVDARILLVQDEDVAQRSETAQRKRRNIGDDDRTGGDARTADIADHPVQELVLNLERNFLLMPLTVSFAKANHY